MRVMVRVRALKRDLKVVRFMVVVGNTAIARLGTLVVAKATRVMSRTCTKLLRSGSASGQGQSYGYCIIVIGPKRDIVGNELGLEYGC